MGTAQLTSGIRDNRFRGSVADFLRANLKGGSRLAVVSAYFTIYAYEKLKEELDRFLDWEAVEVPNQKRTRLLNPFQP